MCSLGAIILLDLLAQLLLIYAWVQMGYKTTGSLSSTVASTTVSQQEGLGQVNW